MNSVESESNNLFYFDSDQYNDVVNAAPVPDEDLRWRVVGNRNEEAFRISGKKTLIDIERSLSKINKPIEKFKKILDFGCGCGRVSRWLLPLAERTEIFGTDYDEEAINWCQSNLQHGTFSVNKELPPTQCQADEFDFIFAISIFSHLDEPTEHDWLKEISRIAKPGGIVLLTVKGVGMLQGFKETRLDFFEDGMKCIKKTGFYCTNGDFWKGTFPKYFSDSYHTQQYIEREWSKYFEVLKIIPEGMSAKQDSVLLACKGV